MKKPMEDDTLPGGWEWLLGIAKTQKIPRLGTVDADLIPQANLQDVVMGHCADESQMGTVGLAR